MAVSQPYLGEQFDDMEQQREAASLGMWVFLCTEILLFGGLFLSYTAYRTAYPGAFKAGSKEMEYWIGTVNTAVLLISSLTMALAIHQTRAGNRRAQFWLLVATLLLGLTFLGLKGLEYAKDFENHVVPGYNFSTNPPYEHEAIFFVIYFIMTGLHALHLTIGCGLVVLMILFTVLGRLNKQHYIPLELVGLYWHFVDIVWVFLYPLIYLPGRHL